MAGLCPFEEKFNLSKTWPFRLANERVCQNAKRHSNIVSEIKPVEKYLKFGKLKQAIQHGLQGLYLKISKVSQRREQILVIFIKVGLWRK